MKYLFLLLALTACGSDMVYKPVSVDKPVAVTCHIPQVTPPSVKRMQISDSLFGKVQAMIENREAQLAYEAKLAAAEKACQ